MGNRSVVARNRGCGEGSAQRGRTMEFWGDASVSFMLVVVHVTYCKHKEWTLLYVNF